VHIVQHVGPTAVVMTSQQASNITGNLLQKLHSAASSYRSVLQSNLFIEQVYIATDSQADVHGCNHSHQDDASPHIPHLKPSRYPHLCDHAYAINMCTNSNSRLKHLWLAHSK